MLDFNLSKSRKVKKTKTTTEVFDNGFRFKKKFDDNDEEEIMEVENDEPKRERKKKKVIDMSETSSQMKGKKSSKKVKILEEEYNDDEKKSKYSDNDKPRGNEFVSSSTLESIGQTNIDNFGKKSTTEFRETKLEDEDGTVTNIQEYNDGKKVKKYYYKSNQEASNETFKKSSSSPIDNIKTKYEKYFGNPENLQEVTEERDEEYLKPLEKNQINENKKERNDEIELEKNNYYKNAIKNVAKEISKSEEITEQSNNNNTLLKTIEETIKKITKENKEKESAEQSNEKNTLLKIIDKLEKENEDKEKLIEKLNKRIKEFGRDEEDLGGHLCVQFISFDGKINHCLSTRENEVFVRLEQKLYENYPELKENENNIFIANGRRIKRFKTLNDNKIAVDGQKIHFTKSN